MQAIQVKYLGPTNAQGVRYKAICQAKSITRHRDHEWWCRLNNDEQAMAVATELAESLDWLNGYKLVQGQLPNGDYCHILVEV